MSLRRRPWLSGIAKWRNLERPAERIALPMVDQYLSKEWKAAIALGLLSSSYSTLVSELAAARIGRDAAVDWMTVATMPARDWILSAEPTWSSTLIGIAFHQWADFSWAVVFFGILHRLTSVLNPWQLSLVAIPWSLL